MLRERLDQEGTGQDPNPAEDRGIPSGGDAVPAPGPVDGDTPNGDGGAPVDTGGGSNDTFPQVPDFPVPPVPPPPPSFGLAGGSAGGASSFARPGSAAAAPFRSQYFNANRVVSGGSPVSRFGEGAALAGAGDVFGGGGAEGGGPSSDEELARLIQALAGRRG